MRVCPSSVRQILLRSVDTDQLPLHPETIITSFPRRWGRNKPDSSGVHKSLRETLKRNKEIQSVYHLGKLSRLLFIDIQLLSCSNRLQAFLIIDQCSKVFFDRTQPTDGRPEVMDLFTESIGNVVRPAYSQTVNSSSNHVRLIIPRLPLSFSGTM